MVSTGHPERLGYHEVDFGPAEAARVTLDAEHVDKLASLVEEGETVLDPATVYQLSDTGEYLLVDGRHRAEAYRSAGRKTFPVDIQRGKTKADAYKAAAQANLPHRGLPLGAADRRKAAKTYIEHLLRSGAAAKESDRAIAGAFKISPTTVGKYRAEWKARLSRMDSSDGSATLVERLDRRVGADGRVRTVPPASPSDSSPDEDEEVGDFYTLMAEPFREAANYVTQALKKVKKIEADPELLGLIYPKLARIKKALADARTGINYAAPHAACPKCKGDGCQSCNETGLQTRFQYETWNRGTDGYQRRRQKVAS